MQSHNLTRHMTGVSHGVVLLAALALAGCASPRPVAYSGLQSAPQLRPSGDDDNNGRTPYAYAVPVNWRQYYKIIIEPVEVYQGPDAQFGKIPERGQEGLARYMQDAFTRRLSRDFEIVGQPQPHTLRLKLTLTGATATPPVVGTFSHFDPAGGAYNAVQGLRGKPGLLAGAVVYAIEVHDAQTGRLLNAYVSKQYPSAMNIGASFGPLKAAMKGIDKGADELAEQITRNDLDGHAGDDRADDDRADDDRPAGGR